MYALTGLATKTVYFRGSKADCFRYLNTHYPSLQNPKRKNAAQKKPIFPEIMAISQIVNN